MKKECLNKKENKKHCPCPHVDDCEYHGICCECVKFHREKDKTLPMCLRKK